MSIELTDSDPDGDLITDWSELDQAQRGWQFHRSESPYIRYLCVAPGIWQRYDYATDPGPNRTVAELLQHSLIRDGEYRWDRREPAVPKSSAYPIGAWAFPEPPVGMRWAHPADGKHAVEDGHRFDCGHWFLAPDSLNVGDAIAGSTATCASLPVGSRVSWSPPDPDSYWEKDAVNTWFPHSSDRHGREFRSDDDMDTAVQRTVLRVSPEEPDVDPNISENSAAYLARLAGRMYGRHSTEYLMYEQMIRVIGERR